MTDSTRQKQSKIKKIISKFRKSTKSRTTSDDHKKASKYLEQGRKYYNKKKYSTAKKYFKRALTADALYPLAYYMMGLVLHKENDAGGAMRHWQQAIKLDPESDVAIKADKKIELMKNKTQDLIKTLIDRQKY